MTSVADQFLGSRDAHGKSLLRGTSEINIVGTIVKKAGLGRKKGYTAM